MNEIGSLIKEKRIEKKLKIEDISNSLLISKKYIEAIENNEREKFSSKAYYEGYTKQYIKFLNLDIDKDFAKHLKEEFNLAINIPQKDKINPSIALSLIAILATIIIYILCSSYINNLKL